MTNFALYARVSTTDQLEGMSIEAQVNALRTWANSHGHATREFVDAGKSAWTENLAKRPAFVDMLDAARNHEIDGIAVTHLDRFSRKLLVTLSVLGELGKLGVGFVSLENSSFDFTRPSDRLMLVILGAFAEYYSAELSRKIKRGLETRANKGLKVGLLPFGFVKDDKGDVALDAHDAPGVVLAYESYRASGVSFGIVADVLNSEGFRSRTRHGRVLFNKHSVDEMLCNPMYCGVVLFKGREIPGAFPAIITRELFDEVQAMRQSRRNRRYTAYKAHRVYLLNGIVTCSGCGRVMRAQSRTERGVTWLYYKCMTIDLNGTCPHQSAWVNERDLVPQIEHVIAQFKLPDNWLDVLNEMIAANGKPKPTSGESKAQLNERLARLKKQFEWGHIGEKDYSIKYAEIKKQLAQHKQPEVTAIVNAEQILRSLADAWAMATQDERREMLRAIVDEVVCDPNQRKLVAIKPKQSFRLLFRQMRGLKEDGERFTIEM